MHSQLAANMEAKHDAKSLLPSPTCSLGGLALMADAEAAIFAAAPPSEHVAPTPAAAAAAAVAIAATAAAAVVSGDLPDGWGMMRTNDGRTIDVNNHTTTTQWGRPLPPAPVAHAAAPASADAPSAAAAPSATNDDTPAPITPRLLEFLASLTGYLHLERSYERSQFEHSRRDSSSAKMKKLKRKVERSKPSAVLVPITEEDESIVRSRIFTAGMPEVLPASNFTIKVVEKKGSPRGGDKTARPKDKDGGGELKTIDATTSPAKSAASSPSSSPVIHVSEPSTTRTSTPSSTAGSTPPRDRKSLDELSEGSSSLGSSFRRWVPWRAFSSPTAWPLSHGR